jgi:hypothetical protein
VEDAIMGRDATVSVAEERPILENPWPALIVAFVTIGLAFILTECFQVLVEGRAFWRAILLGPGILAAGLAVYVRPRSSLILGLAAVAAVLASFAISLPITNHPAPEKSAAPPDAQDSSLSARAVNLSVDEAQYYGTVVLARFQDSALTGVNQQFTAMIHWGDGRTSTGLVRPTRTEQMVVKGSHPYADEGFYHGQVMIEGPNKRHVTVGFTTRVAVWDSGRLLLRILAVLSAAAAVVVLLPRVVQYVVVSALIVFHFVGILTAITNVDPQPWLSAQLWTYVYRPYLQFIYMNNAYHYYAPDPGPASLLWFRIEYAPKERGDNQKTCSRWIQVASLTDDCNTLDPDGKPFRLHVEYTRRLSLGESVNQHVEVDPVEFEQVSKLRNRVVQSIPLHPNLPISAQYLEPPAITRLWTQSYVRHVARTWPHPAEHPDWVVHHIKVYLVHHEILGPDEFATQSKDNPGGNQHPNDPSTFHPFFEGEFWPDGQFTDECLVEVQMGIGDPFAGKVVWTYRDPTLYWLIPIYKTLKPEKLEEIQKHPERAGTIKPTDFYYYDGLKKHAGDTPLAW